MADVEKLAPNPLKDPDLTEAHEESLDNHSQGHLSSEPSDADEKAAQSGQDGGPVTKKTSKASVNNYAAIPNGGLQAWLQVAGGFMLFFNTCTSSAHTQVVLAYHD